MIKCQRDKRSSSSRSESLSESSGRRSRRPGGRRSSDSGAFVGTFGSGFSAPIAGRRESDPGRRRTDSELCQALGGKGISGSLYSATPVWDGMLGIYSRQSRQWNRESANCAPSESRKWSNFESECPNEDSACENLDESGESQTFHACEN